MCLCPVFVFSQAKKNLVAKKSTVKAGETVVIPVEHFHAIKALTQLTFIEVQNGYPLIEEDIERFEYKWKNNK